MNDGIMKQNEIFLSLAAKHGFNPKTGTDEYLDQHGAESFGQTILKIMSVQEELNTLKLKKKKVDTSEKFGGLTDPTSFSQLLEVVEKLSGNLSYIVQHCRL